MSAQTLARHKCGTLLVLGTPPIMSVYRRCVLRATTVGGGRDLVEVCVGLADCATSRRPQSCRSEYRAADRRRRPWLSENTAWRWAKIPSPPGREISMLRSIFTSCAHFLSKVLRWVNRISARAACTFLSRKVGRGMVMPRELMIYPSTCFLYFHAASPLFIFVSHFGSFRMASP